ncbi:Hypothetical_protein [Hexamita inflata]|uniref:Hypothetical_protein n=1 Tax=Hexamita inflata TaxID=28002 RepID=A0AA86T8V1_9EUKA|nr:Hypothetical protein HINF_LOCUS164 [Hexamita inflata]
MRVKTLSVSIRWYLQLSKNRFDLKFLKIAQNSSKMARKTKNAAEVRLHYNLMPYLVAAQIRPKKAVKPYQMSRLILIISKSQTINEQLFLSLAHVPSFQSPRSGIKDAMILAPRTVMLHYWADNDIFGNAYIKNMLFRVTIFYSIYMSIWKQE